MLYQLYTIGTISAWPWCVILLMNCQNWFVSALFGVFTTNLIRYWFAVALRAMSLVLRSRWYSGLTEKCSLILEEFTKDWCGANSFLKKYFIYFKVRMTWRDICHSLVHVPCVIDKAGPGWSQQSGTPSWSPTWVAETQGFLPSSTSFPGTQAERKLDWKYNSWDLNQHSIGTPVSQASA